MLWIITSVGCAPVFTADISGYVLDSETFTGIPGVEIKFFENEPPNFADTSFIYQTSTDPSGFFQQPVIWDEYLPKYWTDGDVISIYFTVVHPLYKSKIDGSLGIVSGVSNTIPTTFLSSLNAHVENLKGSIYSEIEPLNGVQVAIYNADDPAENPEPISRTLSANIDGLDGQFVFDRLEWSDTMLTGLLNVIVRVEDSRYTNSVPSEITATLYRDEVPAVLEKFIVEPIRPEIFSARISGALGYLIESEFGTSTIEPIVGAEVMFNWFYDDENQSIPTSTTVRSDMEGIYSTNIYWVDDTADSGSGIPVAEDQLEVEVTYPAGGANERSYNLTSYNDTVIIRSWIDNTLPDAYEISIYEPTE